MSLALQFPRHYTSMDSSHVSVDPNPGFPQSMWPSVVNDRGIHTLGGKRHG